LRARNLGQDAAACKEIQEVGAWVLDTMWTVLLTNAGVLRPSAQYLPVPNNVYAHMKGAYEAEPLKNHNDENIGNMWEAYGTLLFLGGKEPDWRGLRSIIYRAMISYEELQNSGAKGSWMDRAKAWAPDITDWDEVFEAARAKAHAPYDDVEETAKDETDAPDQPQSDWNSSSGNYSDEDDAFPAGACARSPTGVWDEEEHEKSDEEEVDFGVGEDEGEKGLRLEEEERLAAEEMVAEQETQENEKWRKEAFIKGKDHEEALYRRYKIEGNEDEGERRSKPRVSRARTVAAEDREGGGATSAEPGGTQSPAKTGPEMTDQAKEEFEEECPVVCPEEIIERYMVHLRALPARGQNPYVQRRERKNTYCGRTGGLHEVAESEGDDWRPHAHDYEEQSLHCGRAQSLHRIPDGDG
jgi:hypothetical protein